MWNPRQKEFRYGHDDDASRRVELTLLWFSQKWLDVNQEKVVPCFILCECDQSATLLGIALEAGRR
jgi:hypothetical protein